MMKRYLLAFCAGAVLALAFPNMSAAGFGWVAPGALLLAGLGLIGGAAFRVGMAGGIGYFLTALHWLLYIPVPFLPILGWIGLSVYLSLWIGLWMWLSVRIFPGRQRAPREVPVSFVEIAQATSRLTFHQRILWSIQAAGIWVAMEMIIARFLSGFPWLPLGMSQYKLLPLIQVSSYTGVYGVSFLMVWFATCALVSGLLMIVRPLPRTFWIREVALAGTITGIIGFMGYFQVKKHTPGKETIKAALVQPSIPQTLIWDETENSNRFVKLIELSEKALEEKPQLLIWPEASVPTMIRHDENVAKAILKLVKENKVWLILGSDDAEIKVGSRDLRDISYYNSSFAVSPEGRLAGNYRKRRLVIFGEYIPFVKQLPFMKYFSPAGETGFTPGEKAVPFILPDLSVKTSILICFEDVFPHLVREYAQTDTDFLLNLTNNGWFGESAAQWQHAANAAFRAVENRIPLVRCANNGLTCWVDEMGGMHDVYFKGSRDIYQQGYKITDIPVLAKGEVRTPTFYTRNGDVFGWTCVAVFLGSLGMAVWQKRKENLADGQ